MGRIVMGLLCRVGDEVQLPLFECDVTEKFVSWELTGWDLSLDVGCGFGSLFGTAGLFFTNAWQV